MKRMTQIFRVVAAAGLACVVAAGCGVKKEVHQKCLDELTATQARLDLAEQERDANAQEVASLQTELSERAEMSDETRRRMAKLTDDMQATEQELLELRAQQQKAEERLKAFRQLYDRFQALVDTGKLQVDFRNGQMVLKLPSEVLFPSGRAKLSDKGQEALSEVLNILMEFKDRRFLVAGHTDAVKIRGGRFKDNWDLSTARAVSVVDYMVEAGFDPNNLGAAGYGEFDPVAPNDTAENRALNRRIEIILVPDLSELPNLTVEENS
ncbi:OmpA/MotB family protein [Haliangium ochraceum]|uniref:OmpA/MotB domain protein n=1 Tax=Haliangium ochraceum (strain DSM 14365 / JCM 11303 / SMP-2) TaxID=502025 RepID=D0LT30_HALO1|nr:OmpA family protein [Haliangium ochraceum]ACY19166.1 OmpA/MotB domain protein [Haliangium ochraceum DSM 14365]